MQAINDLHGMDLVPEPKVIIAALHACRRLNDYAVTTRFLEAIQDKCAHHKDVIYPYILQVLSCLFTPIYYSYCRAYLALYLKSTTVMPIYLYILYLIGLFIYCEIMQASSHEKCYSRYFKKCHLVILLSRKFLSTARIVII